MADPRNDKPDAPPPAPSGAQAETPNAPADATPVVTSSGTPSDNGAEDPPAFPARRVAQRASAAAPSDARLNTPADAETLALIALAHVASDDDLLPRFLALSGLDLDDLRARAQDPVMLGAVLDFLLAHEPDLIAFAEAQEIAPAAIARARRALPGATVEE
ncbi:MAG: DUF3572 domain-containing protein [Rhodospirillaceae bacterium]|nr:DUF3572 domain-containing protein [Rhodospirillaceae bacterium]